MNNPETQTILGIGHREETNKANKHSTQKIKIKDQSGPPQKQTWVNPSPRK